MESGRRPETKRQDSSRRPGEPRPKVAIIVLNWNGSEDTIGCLKSIRRLLYNNRHVIVVDNGSTDDSVGNINTWAKGQPGMCVKEISNGNAEGTTVKAEPFVITLLAMEQNIGVGGGYAAGMRFAVKNGYEWIWLLDQDSRPDPGSLDELIHSWMITNDKKVEVLFPTRFEKQMGVIYVPLRWSGHKWYKAFAMRNPRLPLLVNGAGFSGMLLRINILNAVKYPRSDYFIDYDDYEFCLQICKAGYHILYVPSAQVAHKVGRTQVRRLLGRSVLVTIHAPFRYYYQTRNRMYTHIYVHPNLLAAMWAFVSVIKLVLRVILYERKKTRKLAYIGVGVVDALLKRMGRTVEPT